MQKWEDSDEHRNIWRQCQQESDGELGQREGGGIMDAWKPSGCEIRGRERKVNLNGKLWIYFPHPAPFLAFIFIKYLLQNAMRGTSY